MGAKEKCCEVASVDRRGSKETRLLDLGFGDGEMEGGKGVGASTSCPSSSRLARGLGLVGAIRDGGNNDGGMLATVGVSVCVWGWSEEERRERRGSFCDSLALPAASTRRTRA